MVELKAQIAALRRSKLFDRDWYLQAYPDVAAVGMDPLEHFVRVGAALGRNPGPGFDTAAYLRRHGKRLPKGINPLYSFIQENRRAVAEPDPFPPLAGDEPLVDVYVSCWLRKHETVHDGLVELVQRLAADGLRATFITHTEVLANDPRVDTLFTSFFVSFHDLYRHVEDAGPDPGWLGEVVAVEQVRLESAGKTAEAADMAALRGHAKRAYLYWRRRFEITRPRLVLIWGSTSAISKVHMRTCHELDIPVIVLERGHFSKTLSVDVLAQFAHASVNLQPHSALQVARSCTAADVAPMVEWVRACEETPYAHKNKALAPDPRISAAREAGRKVVLFIGVNNYGSGVAYQEGVTRERHSFLYASTEDAFAHVRTLLPAIDPDALLVFKPHPADRGQYETRDADDVVVCGDANINDLIATSDVCVTLSTTALARCVVEARPTVLLALSDFTMKGLGYEVTHRTELGPALRGALYGDDLEARIGKGYAFLKFLFDERLVGVGDEVPTRLHMREFAEFLSQRVRLFSPPGDRPCFLPDAGMADRIDVPVRDYLRAEPEGEDAVPPAFRREVDVVIPVYGDAESTRACIDSVLAARSEGDGRVIILCDCSPDPEVVALVDRYRDNESCLVLHNPTNLGFIGTANRGISLAAGRDVVLLNSDTLVPPGWLPRLRSAAYARADIGTVTPFSNNAGIFSNPYPGGRELAGGLDEVRKLDALAQSGNGPCVEVPAGHGFCLYIRRSCLQAIGVLDEESFGRGYSEEIDFCLRARQNGFRNMCATSVYVGHVGGLSFADEADDLKQRNRAVIEARYPGYFKERRAYNKNDSLTPFRLE